jgi:hypothetical protein
MQAQSEAASPTRIAVLGTLAEFHREPIPYDLAALVQLVSDLHPDLLCLDMTQQQWQQQDFGNLPPEYREALLPLAYQTDIVVAPIAEEHPPVEPTATGRRGRLITLLRQALAYIQRNAPGPAAINQGWRHDLANLLYHLIAELAGGQAEREWQVHRQYLTEQILNLAWRDPGRRILVVVNIRHCHHIRPALRKHLDIQVVPYAKL